MTAHSQYPHAEQKPISSPKPFAGIGKDTAVKFGANAREDPSMAKGQQ